MVRDLELVSQSCFENFLFCFRLMSKTMLKPEEMGSNLERISS